MTTSHDQPIETHLIKVMKVVMTNDLGAFLDSGTPKNILLPHSEQLGDLSIGDTVIVYIKEDQQQRPLATEKFEKILLKNSKDNDSLKNFTINQEVDLLIYDKSDLGFKALINNIALGILYKNEVFQELRYGQAIKGYIKKIRNDGKIDLILRAPGHKATEDISLRIIELLEDHNGFYNLTDKTSPETIYELFKVSKKKYKIALGGLYKQKIISVSDDGIRLVKK